VRGDLGVELIDLGAQGVDQLQQHRDLACVHIAELAGERRDQLCVARPHPRAGQLRQHLR
jgi:hypothetical protein